MTTTSLNEEVVRQALASLKDTKGLGTQATIGQVRSNLTAKPSIDMYVGIAGIMTTANSFLAVMGQQPIQVPADLPPVGMSATVQDAGAASRLFVPIPVVRFIKDSKAKVQASIQADVVRVSGKDRDTLQDIIAKLKEKDFGIHMQFTNYRTN